MKSRRLTFVLLVLLVLALGALVLHRQPLASGKVTFTVNIKSPPVIVSPT